MKSIQDLISPSRIRGSKVPLEAQVSAVLDTTRDLRAGALFFALKGLKHDGHAFALQAVASGAMAAVVDSPEVFANCPRAVLVDSTRAALGEAASRWEGDPTSKIRLVGVTGTNGKTTSTFLLRGIWEKFGLRSGLVGTVEYRIGAETLPAPLTTPDPLTLQRLFARMRDSGVECAAMEVSSIALDQRRVAGCHFEVALFTNLTQDHLDYHGDMRAYLHAKRRLFTDYAPKHAVLNADDPASQALSEAAQDSQVWTFSLSDKRADFHCTRSDIDRHGLRATLHTPQGEVELVSPLLGSHNLSNCLGVLAVQHALGLDVRASAEALRMHPGAPGRLERVGSATDRPSVFVDYAHTEDALENVLQSLRRVRSEGAGRIWTVFGCGGDRDRGKRPRMAQVAARLSDVLVLTSDNPRTEDPQAILDEVEKGIPQGVPFQREADRKAAIRLALQNAEPGDFVLIAGKGHETYQILGTQKVPFDDREVIRDYYGDC